MVLQGVARQLGHLLLQVPARWDCRGWWAPPASRTPRCWM